MNCRIERKKIKRSAENKGDHEGLGTGRRTGMKNWGTRMMKDRDGGLGRSRMMKDWDEKLGLGTSMNRDLGVGQRTGMKGWGGGPG